MPQQNSNPDGGQFLSGAPPTDLPDAWRFLSGGGLSQGFQPNYVNFYPYSTEGCAKFLAKFFIWTYLNIPNLPQNYLRVLRRLSGGPDKHTKGFPSIRTYHFEKGSAFRPLVSNVRAVCYKWRFRARFRRLWVEMYM